jgi:hypothetical protein
MENKNEIFKTSQGVKKINNSPILKTNIMKKTLLSILLLTTAFSLFAQDQIIRKSGEMITCTITKIDSSNIYFDLSRNGLISSTKLNKTQVQNIDQVIAKFEAGKRQKNLTPGFEHSTEKISGNSKSNKFGIYVNPLGLLQFGPMAGAEIVIHSHLVIDGHVRFSSLGALMYVTTKDEDDGKPYKISGLGVGLSVKYLAASRNGGFYAGMLFEEASQKQYYAEEQEWTWQSEIHYFVCAPNLGYKFAFKNGFYVNTGVIIGAAFVYKDEWHHTKNYDNDSAIHENGSSVRLFGMLELTLGYDF